MIRPIVWEEADLLWSAIGSVFRPIYGFMDRVPYYDSRDAELGPVSFTTHRIREHMYVVATCEWECTVTTFSKSDSNQGNLIRGSEHAFGRDLVIMRLMLVGQ